ncbi:hypothetical protein GCM10022403_042890 [Streptomyces coacervatus]|uniref:Uncharacterized protein n=1 Tax=Streptomyces coacervatus TaxID=647381 RepID=A0ABP7I268_9ACTN
MTYAVRYDSAPKGRGELRDQPRRRRSRPTADHGPAAEPHIGTAGGAHGRQRTPLLAAASAPTNPTPRSTPVPTPAHPTPRAIRVRRSPR